MQILRWRITFAAQRRQIDHNLFLIAQFSLPFRFGFSSAASTFLSSEF